MKRRNFIKSATVGTSAIMTIPWYTSAMKSVGVAKDCLLPLNKLKKPLAIAMWDFSWILRHHRYGEFENWDKVLEELAERGYNAIRIDVMPQYVAADSDGKITEEFRSVRKDWGLVKWGNHYTMSFRPREALLEFLPKCRKYGIRVGLSSWFINHNTGPRNIFKEEGGALRAWTETLEFLRSHKLLDDNIIYIDLLNEYPFWHGYDWFKGQINARGDIEQFKLNNPEAFVPDDNALQEDGVLNVMQLEFKHKFANTMIRKLKSQFPDQVYHMSITQTTPLESVDLSEFGTLDYHIWLAIEADIPHWTNFRNMDQSQDNRALFQELMRAWYEKRSNTIKLADDIITAVADKAQAHKIPCGNTEGWGPVGWIDHPELNWKWIKDAGDICVDLARKHDNYKYLCTSNFTHPQFKGIWEDVKWHKNITKRIKA